MTIILFDGNQYRAYPCTAIPAPQEAENFDLIPGQRVPAILMIADWTGYKAVSWSDPMVLDGRDVIDGDNGTDADKAIAEQIAVQNYAYTQSLDCPLDFEAVDTAMCSELI